MIRSLLHTETGCALIAAELVGKMYIYVLSLASDWEFDVIIQLVGHFIDCSITIKIMPTNDYILSRTCSNYLNLLYENCKTIIE